VDSSFFMVLAVFGVGQVLESQILTPKIIGDRVGLHPLWLLFGMLAGAVLLGFVGVLLAVPLTAVIGVLAKFAIGRYLKSGLYLNQ
jgi:predicted PurR-regulated permease PerM